MSATLGSMLAVLEPDWRIVLVERGDVLAGESSDPWNNAGTGHSGFCELNYMPDPSDATRPSSIARQFLQTRQWWAHLAHLGLLDPQLFVHGTPHMDLVFGDSDVEYLRRRFTTLRAEPLFATTQFSDDPAVIAGWAPLVMDGRQLTADRRGQPVAATFSPDGTDVDFGALTRALVDIVTDRGGEVRLGHEVRGLDQRVDGSWRIHGRRSDGRGFDLSGLRVFVGAGGQALHLLQRAGLPEVRGYGVLPVGAAFLRCSTPEVVARHSTKVYGQADVGAPPMSVPHLDKRHVDGKEYLLFGPYATFSTKLLKHGRWTDFFTTISARNIVVILAAVLQNLSLVRYLIGQLAATRRRRIAQLRKYYPAADADEWEYVAAGQRAQLITPDPDRLGVIQQGTELVVSADGSASGLLGASPGASTAVPIMLDLLARSWPDRWQDSWSSALQSAIPAATQSEWDVDTVARFTSETARVLGLDVEVIAD
ncbi:malate:quinone oxidoreductase [Gordonia sputi]|uniref:malate:quinone oxidoreductase n=1 Tax=Gordonia sputi TaxID=36823 RepID=UPI0036B84270